MASQVPEPTRPPDEAWRTTAALRMLRTRDLRSIFNLARLHGIRPEYLATRCGLTENFVLKVMTGDAAITDPGQIHAIADALDMPLPARSALGVAPRPRDPLVMPAEFWERPEIAQALIDWNIPAVLTAVISERRWTQHKLAEVLGYSQSWVSNVIRETQSLTLDQAKAMALKFGAPLHKLTIRSSESSIGQRSSQAARPTITVSGTSASGAAEADARNVIAWAGSTNISDDVIDYLVKATTRAAEDHVSLPPAVMLPRVQQLHATVATLLQGGRQRLRQTRELLRLDAELLAHLCQLLGDVHRDQAASAYSQAAVVLAHEAGSSPATAFSAQAQIARWRHRHTEAADLAAEGLRRGAPPPLRVLLAYQEATAAAAAGEGRRAHTAVACAEAADNGQAAPDSIWSCPPRKAGTLPSRGGAQPGTSARSTATGQ